MGRGRIPTRVRVHARLELDYADEPTAERMLASVQVDNAGYARSWREGSTLVTEAEADGPGALRHTLEDLLACLAAAEGADRAVEEDAEL